MTPSGESTLAVAICTRARPEALRTCLGSLQSSAGHLAQVLVSDDDPNQTAREVVDEFRGGDLPVEYRVGPAHGLSANRNHCIEHVSADLVLFLDDDARLDRTFLETALPLARRSRGSVVTGYEWRDSAKVTPHAPDFLGFQRAPAGAVMRSIVINATIFPSELLRLLRFDEFFEFGYEEVDIAWRARLAGRDIVYVDAGNFHDHIASSREGNARKLLRSRAYFGARRYGRLDRDLVRLAVFLLYGLPHATLAEVKRGGIAPARNAASDFLAGVGAGFRENRVDRERRVAP